MTNEMVDIHSHILPGVDDGAKSMEESLQMLRIAEAEGITDIIATPHYQSGRFFTPAEKIEEFVGELRERAKEAGIRIGLYPGTEIYYRSGLEERLDRGELATMNKSSRVLLEFSPFEEFNGIRNAMEDILGMGYTPILAHVERFACLSDNMEAITELRAMGCEIQVNAGSIAGRYSFRMRRYLNRLLREELIDYVGTDAHNTTGRAPQVKRCRELLYRRYPSGYVDKILFQNAIENLLREQEV